ncbi:MAG: hypothetical protein M3P51_07240, partial [Chloroflexota bacterium]|nr:hypothetical protein [Chloroflexota bacterium]
MVIASGGLRERLTLCLLVALLLIATLPTPALAAPEEEWTRRFGTEQDDRVWGLAVGPQGVYVGGGIGPDTAWTTTRAYLRKYDSDGGAVWTSWSAPPQGQNGRTEILSLALDETGVYAGGWISRVSDNDYLEMGLLRKYSHGGSVLWERHLRPGKTRQSFVSATAADETGLYVTILSPGGTFLRRYNSDGDLLWTRPSGDYNTGLDIGTDGVYVSGVRDNQAFLEKFTHGGRHVWVRRWDVFRLAVSGEDVYVLGSQTTGDGRRRFLRKYSVDGRAIWT